MVEKIPEGYILIGDNGFSFYFWNKEAGLFNKSKLRTEKCTRCNYTLVDPYVDIINKLKEKNLLDKTYEVLCCNCYRKKELDKIVELS